MTDLKNRSKTRLAAGLCSLGLLALGGCNAVEGLGQDLQEASTNVQQAIDPETRETELDDRRRTPQSRPSHTGAF